MNTRLQVEHPVTEMITGFDLVEWQLRIAAGEKLPCIQEDIMAKGHAFEVRLYAEDPAQNFLPQTGKVQHFSYDLAKGMRVDTGIETGDSVTSYYDPMIAKLITWGHNRDEAAARMAELLKETQLTGLNSNQEFLHSIFCHPDFLKGDVDTGFIARHEDDLTPADYGRPRVEDIGIAALYYLLGLNQDSEQQDDPWQSYPHWRMGGTASQKLDLVSKGDIIPINAQCASSRIEFSWNDINITAVLSQFSEGKIEALINGKKNFRDNYSSRSRYRDF